jgi:2-haloacid dehalogenase
MPITTAVFDAYGTLFDVASAARALAQEPGRADLAAVWQKLAADWRTKQLSYSWLRAVSGDYTNFWQVTQDGLDWALEANGLRDPELRERLLALYWELAAYPEVPAMLADLKAAGIATAILSNGSKDMLDGAVSSAGLNDLLDAFLSVEDVGNFKPDRRVYDLVAGRFGTTPDQVLFVSSNGWDAAAAAAFGFTVLWANRAGEPVDRLPGRPQHQARDLVDLAALATTL